MRTLLALFLLASTPANAIRPRSARGAVYTYDFTSGVPSTVTCSRSAGTYWPQTSASTTSKNTAGSTCVWENRTGNAFDGGIWTADARTNVLTAPNTFGTWSTAGSGVVTDNAVSSPDGTSNAATFNKNQSSTFFAVEKNLSVTQPAAFSFWIKNNSTPTAHGMTYWDGSGTTSYACHNIPDPPPATWTRETYWFGTMANTSSGSMTPFAIAPAGLACGVPTFTNSATGEVNFWGVQLVNQVDVPLNDGSVTAQTLKINSSEMSRLLMSGDFEIDVFARLWIQELRAQPSGCLWGGLDSSSAEDSLCYTANNNSATAALWTFKMGGATVLTTNMGLPVYGGEIRARTSCRPSSNTSVLEIAVNGSTMYSTIAIGTCNGGSALNSLTSFWLGSNNGTASFWPAQFTRVVSYARPQAYNRHEIVELADSIGSWTSQTDANGNRLDNYAITSGAGALDSTAGGGSALAPGTLSGGGIYSIAQSRDLQTHPGIAAVVTPGATCETIESSYITTPYYGSGYTHAITIRCGTNNINPSGGNQSAATAFTHYDHLAATAKTANPAATIICEYVTPWSTQSAKVNALNSLIAGSTNCDRFVPYTNTSLDDGAGNCTHCVDNIHPDNIGRAIMYGGGTAAGTIKGELTAAHVLP